VTKIAIIYYSSTGHTYQLAQAVEEGAHSLGAETRLRRVRELAPDQAIASNQGWQQHLVATQHVEEAILGDLEWADGLIFGTPTRYGNVSAQLKQFIDTTGPLWFQGKAR
jgi:NAD(P)H dehydrogenase (quinone)